MMVFTIDQVVGIVLLTIGIMILLAFFVLMNAISKVEAQRDKYKKAAEEWMADFQLLLEQRDALSEALDQERAWNSMRD